MHRLHRLPRLALSLATVLAFPTPASRALTINLNYVPDGQAGSVPAADPDGARLKDLAQAAAAYWETLIEDNHTLNLQVRYDNSISGIGKWDETEESDGRPVSGIISFKGTSTWYYDPTPDDHSEFVLRQDLVRDLNADDLDDSYRGSPPALLEAAFSGPLAATAPAEAIGAWDLYSVILHEIGHGLGMSVQLSTNEIEIEDGDYDIFRSLVNGASFSVVTNTSGGSHTVCPQCLMNPSIGQQSRRLPSATDVLALATCPDPGWTRIDLPRKEFLPDGSLIPGGDFLWHTAGNWVGGQVPKLTDDVWIRVGRQAGVPPGATVLATAAASCRNFYLEEATNLATGDHKFDVNGTTTIEYDGTAPIPQILVGDSGEFETEILRLEGGELDLAGGFANIRDAAILSADTNGEPGVINGSGLVRVGGLLVNDGRIAAEDGSSLNFISGGTLGDNWDLDGQSGNGQVLAENGNVSFSSGGLVDDFSGEMHVHAPHTLYFGEPWALAGSGDLFLTGSATEAANLTGALLSCSGTIVCSQNALITPPLAVTDFGDIKVLAGGFLRITNAVNFQSAGRVAISVGEGGRIRLESDTEFLSGFVSLGSAAEMEFDGVTRVESGTFQLDTDSQLRFTGTHSLMDARCFGAGTTVLSGRTNVEGPMTIESIRVDLDGDRESNKILNLADDLIIRSSVLDASADDNVFDGRITFGAVSGADSVELRVNGLPSWEMAGEMRIESNSPLTLPSISGVPFTMSGYTTLDGSTSWDAVATISGRVDITSPGDTFALSGGTAAEPNRLLNGWIAGPGTFRATGAANLVGHGFLSAPIEFLGGDSRLLASGGTLLISAPFLDVPEVIGTADDTGTLWVNRPWMLTSSDRLLLQGGSVIGDAITNEGLITGSGDLCPDALDNNGVIAASDGGRLVIDTTEPSDLDGLDGSPFAVLHRVDASDGQITIFGSLSDAFDATAVIGAGHDLTFDAPWELGPDGSLEMNGGSTPGERAALLGSFATVRGFLFASDECHLGSQVTFATGSSTILQNPSTTLRLLTSGLVEPGASFTGPGSLHVMPNAALGMLDNAAIDIPVLNEGRALIGGSPGQAMMSSYNQTSTGRLGLILSGRPATGAFDRITVSGPAALAGSLSVRFEVADAQPGDTWKVLDTPALSGTIATMEVIGLPSGLSLIKREESDGLYLELTGGADGTYLDWATAAGIPEALRAVDQDADGDRIMNGVELFLGGDATTPDSGLLPILRPLAMDGTEYLSLTVTLANTFTPSDLTPRVTRSLDGQFWTTDGVVLEEASIDPGSGTETRVYRSAQPLGSLPREFLRFEAGP